MKKNNHTIAILGFNNHKLTIMNLKNLIKDGYRKNILLFDNGSKPSYKKICKKLNVKFLRSKENIYVNPAWNKIFEIIETKYLTLLNNDCFILSKNYFNDVLNHMEKNNIALSSCRTKNIKNVSNIKLWFLKNYYNFFKNNELTINKNFDRQGWIMTLNLEKYKTTNYKIPYYLKVWFGDDWIWSQIVNNNFKYAIYNNKFSVHQAYSTTSDEKIKKIISNDILMFKKNAEKWVSEISNKKNLFKEMIEIKNIYVPNKKVFENKKIIICVPTFKRPNYLEKNLTSLSRQNFDYKYEIVVVDNDSKQSAKPIVSKFKNENNKFSYFVQNKRGIAAVRNKCIDICKEKKADYLIFIDDDEIAEKDWLENLLITSQEYDAEIVEGANLCDFEKKPNSSIQKNFYTRREYITGKLLENCATSNVLINMDIFKNNNSLLFNEKFGLMGGEDTLFFMEVKALGFKMVWCNEAITHEFISIERSKLKNCLLRSFYAGNSLFHLKNNIDENKFNLKYSSIPKTIFNILIIIIRLIFYILTLNQNKFLKNLSRFLEKLGFVLSSITGLKSKQYKNIFGE